MTNHHAQLFVGQQDDCARAIAALCAGAEDVEYIHAPQLTVDIARQLKMKAATRPRAGDARHLVITCTSATSEAQNALLKLFEDPPQTARFYLSVPRASLLLPTLRSRLHTAYTAPAAAVSPHACEFLAASYAERLARIAQMQRAKDTHAMRELIEHVTYALSQEGDALTDPMVLREVVRVADAANLRGASLKMLLEHLALAIPERRASVCAPA